MAEPETSRRGSVLAEVGRDLEIRVRALDRLLARADQNANVIFGAVIDDSLGDEVRVTVIATGFGTRMRRRRVEASVPQPVGAGEQPVERSDAELEIPSFLRED